MTTAHNDSMNKEQRDDLMSRALVLADAKMRGEQEEIIRSQNAAIAADFSTEWKSAPYKMHDDRMTIYSRNWGHWVENSMGDKALSAEFKDKLNQILKTVMDKTNNIRLTHEQVDPNNTWLVVRAEFTGERI